MLEIGTFEAAVDVRGLLDQKVQILSAAASNARVVLEWSEDEGFNWIPPARAEKTADETTAGAANTWRVLLDRATVDDVTVIVRHPSLTDELQIDIAAAEHTADDLNNLVVNAVATLKDRAFAIDTRIGPFPELIRAGAIDGLINIEGENATLKADVSVAQLKTLTQPNADISLIADDTDRLLRTFEIPIETRGPTNLSGNVTATNDETTAKLAGNLGAYQVAGDLRIEHGQQSNEVRLTVSAAGEDLNGIGDIFNLPLPRDQAFSITGSITPAQDAPDTVDVTLSVGKNRATFVGTVDARSDTPAIRGSLEMNGQNLAEAINGVGIAGMPTTAFRAATQLDFNNGSLELTDLSFTGLRASLDGSAAIRSGTARFDLTAYGENFSQFVPPNEAYAARNVPFRFSARGSTDTETFDIDALLLRLGTAELSVSGYLALEPQLEARDLQIQASGERLTDIGDFTDWPLRPLPFS